MAKLKQKNRRTRGKRDLMLYIVLGLAAVMLTLAIVVTVSSPGRETASVSSPAEVQRIPVSVARERVERGEAVLYDTRTIRAFEAGHAMGAISFPEGEALERIDELPTDKDIIFYCT
ncbi:MAG: rhodanese-like domain-containing protein [Anaerolineae bacterium]